jgi:hypothetical protein
MGSSVPSIWLCAIFLQAANRRISAEVAGIGKPGIQYMCTSVVSAESGASPPLMPFRLTSLHTFASSHGRSHTLSERSSSQQREHTSTINVSNGRAHRKRSRRSEPSGSSVPPMRLSLKSLHMIAAARRFSRAAAHAADDRCVHPLELCEHRKHLEASRDSVVRHVTANQPKRQLQEFSSQPGADRLSRERRGLWVRYIWVMRLLQRSVAKALGSGPISSLKLRVPPLGQIEHSAMPPGQSLAQLQLHAPPSLVPIVIASTPAGHGIMRGMQHTAGDQAYVHA